MICKELKDTVNLMTSDNYISRFVSEFEQLRIRTEKLKNVIDKYDNKTLDFEPKSIEILRMQYKTMCDYKDILLIRAELENINLK